MQEAYGSTTPQNATRSTGLKHETLLQINLCKECKMCYEGGACPNPLFDKKK